MLFLYLSTTTLAPPGVLLFLRWAPERITPGINLSPCCWFFVGAPKPFEHLTEKNKCS